MRKNKKPPFGGNSKNFIMALVVIGGCLLFLSALVNYTRQITTISYSAFLKRVESNDVKSVTVNGNAVQGVFRNGSKFETVIPYISKNWDLLDKHNVETVIIDPSNQFSIWYLLPLLSLFLTVFALWYFFRQAKSSIGGSSGGGPGGIFSMGKSKAKLYLPSMIKESFKSVAGAAEAKEELQDVIDYLKNPQKYTKLGAKMTRGILLVGEPGNGKTLIAKAVAGEANCPFFSISGSDFIEVFVGVGASRVRDLFAQARKKTPSIIFIDEIDAVGRHRGRGMGGGNDEREQTLNQLLTEMDGFQTSKDPVIVIAATNRVDVLDKALLRPGRFDRHVHVPFPDLKSREEILKVHAQNIQMDDSIDLHKIARATPGFSGAGLANLINEAALHASKFDKKLVQLEDFEEAWDKAIIGKKRKTLTQTQQDLKITAFHEAGHALVGLLLPDVTDPLHKVTIIARGGALGVTCSLPERDKNHQTKSQLMGSIYTAVGGRAAEELVFNEVTTGAGSDFRKATDIAKRMVCLYGMSDLGTAIYNQDSREFNYSEKTAAAIDEHVQKILDQAYEKSMQLLKDNREKLDKLANALLEKELMTAEEIYKLLDIEPRLMHKL